MYTCRWAYCATICGSLSQLDEHVSGHIDAAPPVDLKGVKRRKVSDGSWRRDLATDGSQQPTFRRISDELPVHHSQTGDTSIGTDTTYPIPSFTQATSFPSQPPGNFSFTLGTQVRTGSNDGETVSSQMEDAEIADEMLMGFLRSPSPPEASEKDLATQPPASLSQGSGIRQRSNSPFVPPTQAQSTQIGVGYRAPSSSLSQPSQSQGAAYPPTSQNTNHSQPSQSSQLSSDSVEIGRSGPSQPLQPSPPDIINPSMPPPAVPISRRASTSRPLLFGSAVTLVDPAGVSPRIDVVRKEKGSDMAVAGPRRSVGFSFGSQLGSGKTDEGSK